MFQTVKSIFSAAKGGAAQGQLIKGNYKKALTLVEKAITLDPDGESNPIYLSIMGKCYYHLNERDIAKEYLVKAEEELFPLLVGDDDGCIMNELSNIRWYIEKCG